MSDDVSTGVGRSEVGVETPDGTMRAFLFTPDGNGSWPAVVLFMDAMGIRPAMFEMCERLSGHGYVVLLPDMFWRAGPYGPLVPAEVLKDEALRGYVFGTLLAGIDAEQASRDTGACLAFLAGLRQVRPGPVGITGYCMGGRLALRAAGRFPDQVAAAAAFHPAQMATEAPDSPHLVADRIKAKVLVAGADGDVHFPAEEADRLRAALDKAGVDNEVTIYQGAHHGYVPADMPAHDEAATERHWRELLDLFDGTLKAA